MRPWIARHLGLLTLAGLVLAVAMASSATAALKITGKDIKNGSVTTKDIKDGSLRTADLAAKTRSDLATKPFLGSPCTIPPPQGGTGKVAMNVQPDGVIILLCSTPPVAAVDDDDDLDGFKKSQECNDTRPMVNPAAVEVNGNLIDDDCNGQADDATSTTDTDGDSYTPATNDCDETDATVHPGATDTFGNGVDNNCDGVDGVA